MAFATAKTTICALALQLSAVQLCAQDKANPIEIPLSISESPEDVWDKNRIAPELRNGKLRMSDTAQGPFNDASFWSLTFDADVPFGRKELVMDISVAADHTPLWDMRLLQPIINGAEAVPALDDDGLATSKLLVAEDGKGFIPVSSGTYRFQIPRAEKRLTDFAFMTAAAENYDITLSNFRIHAWPEDDDRVWPQQPRVSSLGYQADRPVFVYVDWHNDEESRAQERLDLVLKGPSDDRVVPVILPRRDATISGSRVSRVSLGQLKPGRYTLGVPAIGERTSASEITFLVTAETKRVKRARDEAWGAFYWITAGPHGPYPDAQRQDAVAQVFGAPEKTADTRGGWFDAGDYGKYSVNGSYAVSLMLLTGLLAPDALDHPIDRVANTPANVPDWLRVADAQLSWLINMQRSDGAVYHKVASRDWPSMSAAPEDDTAIKWLMPVTTTATADFAGTMALAALVYGRMDDPGYRARAKDFAQAATRALVWLDTTPDLKMTETRYDGASYGGPYDDTDDADERFFARAAYALMTGAQQDLETVQDLLSSRIAASKENDFDLSWQSVDLLGLWTLAASNVLSDDVRARVDDALRSAAHRSRVLQNRSSWGVAVDDTAGLHWGSNSAFATRMWHWLMWARRSNDARYVDAAAAEVHYLFGQNPMGKTYVTGAYPNAAAAPHFRPWSSGRITLPAGFIVGGPNSVNLAGDPLTGALAGKAPMRMYADHVDSYATNEVAINWQSTWAVAASLLAASLDPAQNK